MKLINKIAIVLIAIALVLGSTVYYQYTQITAKNPNIDVFAFNDQPVEYKDATINYNLLGFIPFDREFHQDEIIRYETDQVLNELTVNTHTQILVTAPDQSTQSYTGSQALAFEADGEYKISLDETSDTGSLIHYEFFVDVQNLPNITISNLSPLQGEVLIIDITNLSLNSTIVIDSQFSPSAISQTNHEARLYLPMEYKASAKQYPLDITINGKKHTYVLDVQAYDFKKEYFNIDQDILDATTGNPAAANEFKAAIYPLYETFEPVEYWSGNFTLPVLNAEISSGFGDQRYINGSTTPSRHGGIDYAIDCGTDVYASNAGKIDFAKLLIITGNTVVIDHGLGLKTYYEHMTDLTVSQGDMVEKGQLIGHVGTTGVSTGCHLHFQAMIKNQMINPAFLFELIK